MTPISLALRLGEKGFNLLTYISYLLMILFLAVCDPLLPFWDPFTFEIQKNLTFAYRHFPLPLSFFAPIWTFEMATNEFCPCFLHNRQVSFQQTKQLITLKNKQYTVSGGSLISLQWSKLEDRSEIFQSLKQHWAEMAQWSAVGSWLGFHGFTLKWNALLICGYDWPLHRRINGVAFGCHGKLKMCSLCGSLKADILSAKLTGHLPQPIS